MQISIAVGSFSEQTNNLNIQRAAPLVTFPSAAPITFGDALSASALTGGSSTPSGTFDWETGTIIPDVNNTGYNVEFIPDDFVNYNFAGITGWNGSTVVRVVPITVNRAAGAAVGKPASSSVTHNSITISAVTAPGNGQSVEYAISSASDGTGLSAWQTGLTFSGLTPNATYYVYARSAGNANNYPGTPNVSDPITLNDATGTAAFTVTVEQITDLSNFDPIPSNLVLSRSGAGGPTADITVVNLPPGSAIEWRRDGIELLPPHVNASRDTLTLSVNPSHPAYAIDYDRIGYHFVTVIVRINNVPYSRLIEFEVVQ
jgi:hypothetical protein